MRTCDFCGRQQDAGAAALTWSSAMEGGRRRWFCADCSRTHLRAAEARLDSEHW